MNTEVYNEIRGALKTQLNERVPSPLPMIEVNPKIVKNIKFISGTCNNSTASTLMTTPTNQDVYIVGYFLSVIKDATSTSTSSSISIYNEDGALVALVTLQGFTLTVQNQSISGNFANHAIKLPRGTTVRLINTTNVGNISTSGTVFYYIDEASNA